MTGSASWVQSVATASIHPSITRGRSPAFGVPCVPCVLVVDSGDGVVFVAICANADLTTSGRRFGGLTV